jgi:hypothetical protein
VAATGVLVAAAYYVMTLRTNTRTHKIELTTNISQRLGTKEKLKDFIDLADLKWDTVENFRAKYDSALNPESYAKRWSLWIEYDTLGYLLRNGMIDREILFNSQGNEATVMWARYKPIIDDVRKTEMGPRWMENFQYLAEEMWLMAKGHGYVSPVFRDGLVFDSFRGVYESQAESTT